jgi:hypothetical protein
VESFILTERPAPVQRNFYFTHPTYTNDGRFLWVEVGFPPPGGRHSTPMLGVVDFETDTFQIYPETQQTTGRPLADLTNGEVYWPNDLDVWKRGPLPGDHAVRVGRLPADYLRHGPIHRVATHMTFSADRKSLGMDAHFGKHVLIGDLPLDGSPLRVWQEADRFYDHALFSPTDPDVMLFAHEYWQEPDSGKFDGSTPYHRLWIIRRGEKAQPLLRQPVSHSGHEWWDPDGQHVWYVHYGVGIKKVNVATRSETLVWPGHLSHGYSDRTGNYLVADTMSDPKVCDCHVEFFNVRTKKQVEIVNRPPLAEHLTQCGHLHPHPQFCFHDRYLSHTTTIHDRVDLALVPTADLIARTT